MPPIWHGRFLLFPEDRIYLITVGGDGTLNEVINGITDFSRIVLGILPIGSGNDFARGMGISKDTLSNLEQMLDLIESASEGTAIDLGEVSCEALDTPKYFAISSGAGLDAIVCKKALHSRLKKFLNQLHLGKLTYLLLTIESLFSMTTCDADIVFNHGEAMPCQPYDLFRRYESAGRRRRCTYGTGCCP